MTLTNGSLVVAGLKTDTLSGIQNVQITGGGGNNTLDTTGFDGVYTTTEACSPSTMVKASSARAAARMTSTSPFQTAARRAW